VLGRPSRLGVQFDGDVLRDHTRIKYSSTALGMIHGAFPLSQPFAAAFTARPPPRA
jgi:hypothetical protein